MELKYVGPKPIISEHGISFKDGKDDKYVYIQSALEVLHAINHDYEKGKIYKYDTDFVKISDKDVENNILKYKPELNTTIKEQIASYKIYLEKEIENASVSHPLLNQLELEAFKNNLKIMHEYRIQRAINKIYYMHIIQIISEIIKKHTIKDISTPFNERFWHIMQTIQGELAQGKNSIKSTLKENENITLELKIGFI